MPMCGLQGYVSRAHQDTLHHNCLKYVERARQVRNHHPEWSDRKLPMAKHPGLTVGIAELAASCEAIGVEPLFIVTVLSPLQWGHGGEINQACGGDCRHHIIHGWHQCFKKVDRVRSLPNVMLVRTCTCADVYMCVCICVCMCACICAFAACPT